MIISIDAQNAFLKVQQIINRRELNLIIGIHVKSTKISYLMIKDWILSPSRQGVKQGCLLCFIEGLASAISQENETTLSLEWKK